MNKSNISLLMPTTRGKLNDGYLVILNFDYFVRYTKINLTKNQIEITAPTMRKDILFYCNDRKTKKQLIGKIINWIHYNEYIKLTPVNFTNLLGDYLQVSFNIWLKQFYQKK